MVDLTTNIGELVLKNPIMPASGTFSDELANVFDIGKLGAHVAKTITEEIRSGNPTPRVSESGNNMLNSIGIPSKGIENFKKKYYHYTQSIKFHLLQAFQLLQQIASPIFAKKLAFQVLMQLK